MTGHFSTGTLPLYGSRPLMGVSFGTPEAGAGAEAGCGPQVFHRWMSPTTIQIVILAGAYVLALLVTVGASVSSWLAIRALRALDTKRSVLSRVTTVENEIRSHADLVDRLSKRWSKRERDASRPSNSGNGSTSNEEEAPAGVDPDEWTRAQIMRQYGGTR